MNDKRLDAPEPLEDNDPVIDRYLSSLQQFTPRPGFEDRVMAMVEMPAPMPVRYIEKRAPVWLGTRFRWALAAASSVGTVLWASLLSGVVGVNHTRLPALMASQATDLGLPLWRALLQVVANAGSQLGYFLGLIAASLWQALAAAIPTTIVVTLFCAWGLRRLTAQPPHVRARAYASR